MLKDKEVVSDPQRQYEIARHVHALQHGGINKTTATIAEKYHWVRIKETVSLVIKNCPNCKESIRPVPAMRTFGDAQTTGAGPQQTRSRRDNSNHSNHTQDQSSMIERLVDFTDLQTTPSATDQMQNSLSMQNHPQPELNHMANLHHHLPSSPSPYDNLPLDPQIMHNPAISSQQHHQNASHPSDELFEDQLRRATQDTTAHDTHYHLDMSSHHTDRMPGTRMATGRHMRQHDEPMSFVHETGEDGGFEMGRKDGDEDGMHEALVDFDGRGG